MLDLPSGTVTFLFTDIEGSTTRWEHQTEAMQVALARHDTILRSAIETYNGAVFKTVGDAFFAVFRSAPDALLAALAAQRALHAEAWDGAIGPLRVRMALHTGTPEMRGGDYFGPPLNRVARLLSTGYGGQTLLSLATYVLVRDDLPSGVELRDCGEHRLKDLIRPEHIFQLIIPDIPADFPPLRTLDSRRHNLPSQATPLLGRERDVAEVTALVRRADTHLVTLTGPGGIGKTRLSLQVAAEVLDDFADGVVLVELAEISDHRLVVSAIAAALQIAQSGSGSLVDRVTDYLSNRHLLLVLDNFEQVVDAAPLLSTLMQGAPRLTMLVSSRIVLHLYGEREYAVPPLALPDPLRLPPPDRLGQYAAVQLFVERSQAVKPDFQVTSANAPAVAEICARLDGLPLAIELAAARSKVLTPPALLARLDSRLKTLTGGGRDRTARQQTLRGAIDWSYSLLEAAEQVLLARLGVFAGGGTFAAIEAVVNAGDPIDMDLLDGLASLMDKSLIRQLEDTDGEPRFVQFETIREYALERLEARGEAARMRRQHVEYYLGVVEEATPELTGPHQEKWLQQLDHEHGNLRAALDWTLRTPGAGPDVCELGVRLAGALWRFWEIRGHINEGRTWLTLALAVRCDPAGSRVLSARARVLTGAGNLAWAQGAYAEARALHEQSLAQYQQLGDQHGIATALGNLGLVALSQGDRTTARTFHVASLSLRRELGDQRGIATTLNSLAGIALDESDDATARSLYEESLALLRDVGDRRGVAYALGNLGLVAINEGDLDAARGLYEESLGLRRELGDKRGIASALNNLGVLALEQGNIDAARACYEESLALRRELGDRAGIAISLANLAAIAIEQNDYRAARTLYGESLTIQFQLQAPDGIAACVAGLVRAAAGLHDDERAARLAGALAAHVDVSGDYGLGADDPGLDDAIAAVRARLGDQAWVAAWEGGKGMSLTETVAYAMQDLHGAGVAGIAAS